MTTKYNFEDVVPLLPPRTTYIVDGLMRRRIENPWMEINYGNANTIYIQRNIARTLKCVGVIDVFVGSSSHMTSYFGDKFTSCSP